MEHKREKDLRKIADEIISGYFGKITKECFEQFLASKGDKKNG